MSKGQSIEKFVGFERLDLGRRARNELGSESYLAHDGADYGQSTQVSPAIILVTAMALPAPMRSVREEAARGRGLVVGE